jgi:hypothetical protein
MELRTSDEFARWYAALDEVTAEDVAATLEVISQLGPEKEAPGSSEWLTWYEHPSLTEHAKGWLHPAIAPTPAAAAFVHEWGVFQGYARKVVKHLESRAFVARIGQLPAPQAAAVSEAVARIKKTVTRRGLELAEQTVRRRMGLRPFTQKDQAELARYIDIDEIRQAYLAALAAAGFEVKDVPAHSPALREIALRTPEPGLRLLYGIDTPRSRGLVVLGERFDRSFYGDSVRRAEREWADFLATGRPVAEAR